jgi:aspartate-semialdehyde dehydrogenase
MEVSMKGYNVVVLGATGAVGLEFRKILLQRKFPIEKIKFLGKTTVGQEVNLTGKWLKLKLLKTDA